MKNGDLFVLCCMAATLLASVVPVVANPFDDVVLRVTFEGDSVNDMVLDSPSSGTATDVAFEDVPMLPNGNGRAAVFNGTSSIINYGPGFGGELMLPNAFTYHVRLKYEEADGESLVVGGLCGGITCFRGQLTGRAKMDGILGHAFTKSCQPGLFHDVFFRFQGKSDDVNGEIACSFYEAGTGRLIEHTPQWKTGIVESPAAAHSDFTVGGGHPFPHFKGSIEQFNVWNRFLSEEEMGQVAGVEQSSSKNLDAKACSYLREAASERWHRWRKSWDTDGWNTFPIGAWGYFHRFKGTVEEYRTYRDANLTWVIAPLATERNAAKAGLKTLIGKWAVVPEGEAEAVKLHQHPDRLKEYVEYANSHESVAAYLIDDEPQTRDALLPYGPTHRYIYKHDRRDNLLFINNMAYPFNLGGGYPSFIELYTKLTYPAVLSADIYPLRKDGGNEENRFYATYEALRAAALANDIGLMGFVLNTRHWNYREASESDLFWQVYSLVAYGAKGIWYYNYRHTIPGWAPGLVDGETGKPTATHGYAKAVNAEILTLGSLLMQLESTAVFHAAGPEAMPGTEYADGAIGGIEQFKGSDFLLGIFKNRDDPSDDSIYVMVVNKRHGKDQSVNDPALANQCRIKPDGTYPEVYLYDSKTGEAKLLDGMEDGFSLELKGGKGRLLRFSPVSNQDRGNNNK